MLKSIIIFFILCVISFIFLFGLIVGEVYVANNEDTKFGKWWRKYICSPDPTEID
jgi:hypothetical protein